MARKPAPVVQVLPPPPARVCWRVFLLWVLGVPMAVAGALGVIWAALWAAGSGGLTQQADSDLGTVLFWLAVIALLYPAMLWVWIGDLRAGLRAARDWDALSPEARAAALETAAPKPPKPRKTRKPRKGGGDE
jgi:hypothetical protein